MGQNTFEVLLVVGCYFISQIALQDFDVHNRGLPDIVFLPSTVNPMGLEFTMNLNSTDERRSPKADRHEKKFPGTSHETLVTRASAGA